MPFILILSLSITPFLVSGQLIQLVNPSFEGDPADATMPQGWMACKEGTTPDILPGFWGVYSTASDGDTYVGLITRENSTWEGIGQRLTQTLEKGKCYSWSLDLAHSSTYASYSGPVKLRVWISKLKCQKDQMIFQSPLIEDADWKTYMFKFIPDGDYRYILIEAYHADPPFQYKGNILIDRLGPIQSCEKT